MIIKMGELPQGKGRPIGKRPCRSGGKAKTRLDVSRRTRRIGNIVITVANFYGGRRIINRYTGRRTTAADRRLPLGGNRSDIYSKAF